MYIYIYIYICLSVYLPTYLPTYLPIDTYIYISPAPLTPAVSRGGWSRGASPVG